MMRRLVWLAAIGLAAPLAVQAQATMNPVVSSAHEIFTRQAAFMMAAADAMPANKYNYSPTPGQLSFGHIIAHVTQANNGVCAILSGNPAPGPKTSDTDSKEVLIAGMKASFTFCDQTLTNLPDSKLGDTITFFRGAQKPRARALLELTDDLEDHYSQMASYLRMNGLTPPSAQPPK
jgi:hypothetical protein